MKSRLICVVPGCGKRLWEGSTSSVCTTHSHLGDYCTCRACLKRRNVDITLPAAPTHPDRKTVKITYSDGSQKADVTLKRAPWERAG